MAKTTKNELFRQAVQDVKPLDSSRVLLKKKKPISKKMPNIEWDVINFATCNVDEDLFFVIDGLQPKTIKKLRQGKLPIAACLDLHGMTILEANENLQKFLFMCQQNELRHVLIIHGKGSGILKSAINTWLRSYSDTLAFCSAQPKDGGLGAIYLLLSKPKL